MEDVNERRDGFIKTIAYRWLFKKKQVYLGFNYSDIRLG